MSSKGVKRLNEDYNSLSDEEKKQRAKEARDYMQSLYESMCEKATGKRIFSFGPLVFDEHESVQSAISECLCKSHSFGTEFIIVFVDDDCVHSIEYGNNENGKQ
jgi:hypothetical protein